MSEVNVTANGTVVSPVRAVDGGRKSCADFTLEVNPTLSGGKALGKFTVRVLSVGDLADDLMREIDDGDRVLVHGFGNVDRRSGAFYVHAVNVALELKGFRDADEAT